MKNIETLCARNTHKHTTHLCQGLSVRLDVVRAPQHQRNGLWPLAVVVDLLTLKQPLNHDSCTLQGSLRACTNNIDD